MRYYYCVHCGHVDDFGFDRKKNIKCSECKDTNYLAEIDYEDYHYYTTKRTEYKLYKNLVSRDRASKDYAILSRN